jgi:hypothetical protein
VANLLAAVSLISFAYFGSWLTWAGPRAPRGTVGEIASRSRCAPYSIRRDLATDSHRRQRLTSANCHGPPVLLGFDPPEILRASYDPFEPHARRDTIGPSSSRGSLKRKPSAARASTSPTVNPQLRLPIEDQSYRSARP